MSKFYTTSTQAKEFCEQANTTKEKNVELSQEVLLKRGEVIKLIEDFSCLQGIERKLKDEVEELKMDSIENETQIAHLKGKILRLTSSMEKAKEEAIVASMRSDEFKTRLNCHYADGYEDFCADARKAYLNMDFDSFKIPLATESFLLLTISEDVNVVDDASTKTAQYATIANKDDPKSGGDAPSGLSR